MALDIREINEKVEKESIFVKEVQKEIEKVIVGQNFIIDRILVGLLANGHILLEGVPGLAKTLTVKTLSQIVDAKFQRLQFTPDLLPADLIGTVIYNPEGREFTVKKGPIFANLILADEINRAPAKVQSALLEAMQERQITISDKTYKLEEPFLVLATQNPIEQEGTYPLPEAQIDRFMLKLKVTYPKREEEYQIIERMAGKPDITPNKVITTDHIVKTREIVNSIYVDEKIKNYVLDIVFATRNPKDFNLKHLENLITYGASPRASIYLIQSARAYAFVKGRGFVTPDDIKSLAYDILRHRIIISYEAEAEEMTSDDIIKMILDEVEVP